MKMPGALVAITAIVMIFGSISIPMIFTTNKLADIVISCNNLKAAAIAASQPEPTCSK